MIKKEEIKHIAKLARINLSDEEISLMQKEVSSILDYFALLSEVDVSNINPLFSSIKNFDRTREDVASRFKGETKEAFPEEKDGYLKVKEVF